MLDYVRVISSSSSSSSYYYYLCIIQLYLQRKVGLSFPYIFFPHFQRSQRSLHHPPYLYELLHSVQQKDILERFYMYHIRQLPFAFHFQKLQSSYLFSYVVTL